MSFDDLFNEALYDDLDQPDKTPLDNWIEELLFDDSKEHELQQLILKKYGQSSSATSRRWIDRDRESGHEHLFHDYFAPNPVDPPKILWRKFRMGRHVFLRIVDALSNVDPYFQQSVDATVRKGLSGLQICMAAMHMLAYKVSADAVDDYVRIGASLAIECLDKFVQGVIMVFKTEYLQKPNSSDVQRLLQMVEVRSFPSMMGSIDCMYWQWKNCPKAWKGMYMSGYCGVAAIVLEIVALSDLWIWHAFFGVFGSNNDINVLDRSPVLDEVLNGHAPKVNYTVNCNTYTMGYYLIDDIYPEWATLVKAIPRPQGEK